MPRSPVLAALLVLALTGARADDPPAIKLIPGTPVEFAVPGLPPTLAQRYRKQVGEPVRRSIQLPADFSPDRSYPVLVFLSGGDGGGGGEMHLARPFLGDQGYVLCNLPLFKPDIAGDNPDQQLTITPRDAAYALPALRTLLNELRRLVPRQDASRSVLAGFSNGANTAALLLWSGERDLLDRFSTYLLVEGGFWLGLDQDRWSGATFQRPDFAPLAGKRLLFAYGANERPPDRIPFIQDARATVEVLRRAGVNATGWPMADTGHDFPEPEMSRVRSWLLAPTP